MQKTRRPSHGTLFATVRPERPAPTITKSKDLPLAIAGLSVTTVATVVRAASKILAQAVRLEVRIAKKARH